MIHAGLEKGKKDNPMDCDIASTSMKNKILQSFDFSEMFLRIFLAHCELVYLRNVAVSVGAPGRPLDRATYTVSHSLHHAVAWRYSSRVPGILILYRSLVVPSPTVLIHFLKHRCLKIHQCCLHVENLEEKYSIQAPDHCGLGQDCEKYLMMVPKTNFPLRQMTVNPAPSHFGITAAKYCT